MKCPSSKNAENVKRTILTLTAFLVACRSSPVSQNPQLAQLTCYLEVAAAFEAVPQPLSSVFRNFHFSSLTILRIRRVSASTNVLCHLWKQKMLLLRKTNCRKHPVTACPVHSFLYKNIVFPAELTILIILPIFF